jgi:transcriptional regulator with PAS, ATPase and Fis domain
VGSCGFVDVDTRVIAATSQDLEEAMARGEFRADLYYRLNVVEIWVPPLRERPEEIPILASEFLAKFNAQYGRQKHIPPAAMARLTEYGWSGNVRVLENVIRRLVVLEGEQAVEALGACGQRLSLGTSARSVPSESLRDVARRGAARVRSLESRRGRAHSQGELQDLAQQGRRVRAGPARAPVTDVLAPAISCCPTTARGRSDAASETTAGVPSGTGG